MSLAHAYFAYCHVGLLNQWKSVKMTVSFHKVFPGLVKKRVSDVSLS